VAGGEHIQIYNPQADPKLQTSQQQHLLDDIREAVQQQRMNLMFQPIVSMQGDQGERYEVLLRMHKEGRELLPETVFGVTQRHRLGMVARPHGSSPHRQPWHRGESACVRHPLPVSSGCAVFLQPEPSRNEMHAIPDRYEIHSSTSRKSFYLIQESLNVIFPLLKSGLNPI
jgi:hypothetical protein